MMDLTTILPKLQRTKEDSRPVVMMTCGSGKSTLTKEIIGRLPNFERLSADKTVHEKHGLYAIDYPAERYEEYLDEAQDIIRAELARLLQQKDKDVILDLSFWNREYRNAYKEIIENNGGRWVLVFLDADRELLWERITKRRSQRDALDAVHRDGDSAFDIDEKTFSMYWEGFERPKGEGECVIKIL
ncbi:hypothetical protein FDECE_16358 [Fusarium decemcellulare]|nr:hypothetical protein FDECE_16358 [Fusarium decemcellulare]